MKSVAFQAQGAASLGAGAHPLDPLSPRELERACSIVKNNRKTQRLFIQSCQMREPVSAGGRHSKTLSLANA